MKSVVPFPEEISEELKSLLDILPSHIRKVLGKEEDLGNLIEVVLDLGRPPEARFLGRAAYFKKFEISRDDIESVVDRVGSFTGDNRAGIERTLHRISALRNRKGEIIGLTCRVGRAITGTVEIIRDVIEKGESLLLLGPPGVGKTTLLREAARVLADDLGKRVVIVDTSNEIGGDGDVSHPGIGTARRMQVPSPELQHRVMIEAVENHMPEVIVIDEIGTELEAGAARTIAERGVQLIATAHGITLENLLVNPTLSDLIGGIQAVTLSDEEARRRGTQKTVLERKSPPTFDVLVEIQNRDRLAIYPEIARVVDRFLIGSPIQPEIRVRGEGNSYQSGFLFDPPGKERPAIPYGNGRSNAASRHFAGKKIYPFGISRNRLERAIRETGVEAQLADQPLHADIILSLKAQRKRQPKSLKKAVEEGVEFHTLRNNTLAQLKSYLSHLSEESAEWNIPADSLITAAIQQAEDAVIQVQRKRQPVELRPQNSYLRRLQHELIQEHGLRSESIGQAPIRRVVVLPE
jgi:stage III sporulation protein SpoIIIAA